MAPIWRSLRAEYNLFLTPSTALNLEWVRQLGDFAVYQLDGTQTRNEAQFFAHARDRLPQTPGLASRGSWAALADALDDGIDESQRNAVIQWTHPELLAGCDPKSFVNAIGTFSEVDESLSLAMEGELDPVVWHLFTFLVVGEKERETIAPLLQHPSLHCLRVCDEQS